MLRVLQLFGFASAAGIPLPAGIIGTSDFHNTAAASATNTVSCTVPSGGRNRAILVCITTDDDPDATHSVSTVVLDPGGSALALSALAQANNGGKFRAEIWGARLPGSTTGALDLTVTFNETVDTTSVSVIYLENINSLTPTFSGTGTSSTNAITVASVTGEAEGFTIAVALKDNSSQSFTWGSSLTERTDQATGGTGEDHRHSVAYDALSVARSASTETATGSGGSDGAMAVVSLR